MPGVRQRLPGWIKQSVLEETREGIRTSRASRGGMQFVTRCSFFADRLYSIPTEYLTKGVQADYQRECSLKLIPTPWRTKFRVPDSIIEVD